MLAVDAAFAIALTLVGVLAGCWFSRRTLQAACQARQEVQQAQEILAGAAIVTTRVATDVDQHTTRVRTLNDELAAKKTVSPGLLVSTITRLVAANQELQQRLTEADTKLQEQSRQLQSHLAEARTDVLTALPNRRAFDDEAVRRSAEFRRSGRPFSVVLLDLDHFQRVNDRFGRRLGDQLLRGAAAVLLKATRTGDLLARHEGDAFVLLLPGATIDEAREVAERHRRAVRTAPFVLEGKSMSATASAGVAQIMPGEQVETTLRRAERALYLSKQAGRNMTLWHDGRTVHSSDASAGEEEPPASAETPPDARQAPPAAAETPPSAAGKQPGSSPGLFGKLLTHECDRTVFVWQVRQSAAQCSGSGGFSVMLVEVSQYDQLRKAHGEAVAEFALRAARLLLGASLRDIDVVGHYASSCFAVLLPCTRLHEAERVAQRMRAGAAQCVIPIEGGSLELPMSIGIAEYSEGDDMVCFFRRAEAALAAARSRRAGGPGGKPAQGESSGEPLPLRYPVDASALPPASFPSPCDPAIG